MGKNSSYIVAFRYTRKAGGYHGVTIWSCFSSKEDFQKWYTPEIRERQDIVEEGINENRAIELVHQTPLACRMAAALHEATDPQGNVDPDILKAEQMKAMFGEQKAQEYELREAHKKS